MSVSRRRFLQQTIGFSAAVALGGNRMAALAAAAPRSAPTAIHPARIRAPWQVSVGPPIEPAPEDS